MLKPTAQPCGFQRVASSNEFIRACLRIIYLYDLGHRIVIPVVVGSSPISHPKNSAVKTKGYALPARSPFVLLEDEFQILEDRYRKHSNSTCLTESFTRSCLVILQLNKRGARRAANCCEGRRFSIPVASESNQ